MNFSVEPHSVAWLVGFRTGAELVNSALGSNVVAVHHIGSTAIPKIWAKPVIDMLVVVQDMAKVDACGQAMADAGFEAKGEYGIPSRRYFRKHDEHDRRTHHVHVYPTGSEHIARHLAFRDFMIVHPEWAKRYSNLKRELAAKYPHSKSEYVAGKDAFIKHIDVLASTWRKTKGTQSIESESESTR